jgi:DNA processing protein
MRIKEEHNMKISPIALKIWAVQQATNQIKSRASFHNTWKTADAFLAMMDDISHIDEAVHSLSVAVDDMDWMDGAVCCFDTEFPVVNVNAPNGDRPYLLFYKGNLSLLNDLNRNVAVIGYTTPTDEQIARESKIVEQLVNHNQHIVSGLAKGCDGIAHTICMDCGGKTIAILPSPLNSIFPAAHRDMAQRIVETGGLIITEYYDEPHSRHEAINRFVERDRLQALFAKAVILIASYEGRDGDSGSRHAMAKANKYGHMACVMYNAATDGTARDMKLNRSLLELQQARQLVAAKSKSDTSAVTLEEIVQFVNPMLEMADTLF